MIVLWCSLLTVLTLLILLKIYLKCTTGICDSRTCLVGKTVIITGANTGIGFTSALNVAMRGARVILACRNIQKANKARDDIIQQTGNENVVVKMVDLASLNTVKRFAEDIINNENRLDILINNAGAYYLQNNITVDGFDVIMQTNYMGSFYLTLLLLEKMRSESARIINVSSGAAEYVKVSPKQLNTYPSSISDFYANSEIYARSKLCNILFTVELARRLKNSKVTVNAVIPGTVLTEFGRNMPPLLAMLLTPFAQLYFKTADEGAQTILHVAVNKDESRKSGYIFQECKQRDMYGNVNEQLANLVFEETVNLLESANYSAQLSEYSVEKPTISMYNK